MAAIALNAVGASASGDIEGYRHTAQGGLLDLLEALGHRLVDRDSPEATHYVALDHNAKSLEMISARVSVGRRQLVVFEPRMVLPGNYHRRVHRRYGDIISMTPACTPTGNATFLPWPQRDWLATPPATATRVPGTTAVINANKLSSVHGSLYGLRRRVINAFSRSNLPLTLAGSNWPRRGRALFIENLRAIAYAVLNRERLDLTEWARPLELGPSVTHLGIVDDKEAVLLASEFAVVIENSATYVSEKLFDAVIAGCIPLYVGPPLATFGIPEGIVVVLEPRADAFAKAVRELSDTKKNEILQAGREWLALESTHTTWAMPHALRRLAEAIDSNINEEAETP